MIGGPCGQPIKVPNSARKRGYSIMKIRWRIEPRADADPVVMCEGERYELCEEAGKWYYVHSPTPPPPPPAPEVISPMILRAIGRQRAWLALSRRPG